MFFFPFFFKFVFFPILLLVSLLCSFLTFLPPHHLACAIPVTITNSRCREMDEQIRLMDQNLKCLSAAEEKVLTIKPTERFCVWCGFVRFCFCSVLQLPPLHWLVCWVLSHLSMECSIPLHLLGIFHLFFLITSLPLHRVSPSLGWFGGLFGLGIRSHFHPR